MSRSRALTEEQIAHVRFLYHNSACSMDRIANHFKVSTQTVNNIISRRGAYEDNITVPGIDDPTKEFGDVLMDKKIAALEDRLKKALVNSAQHAKNYHESEAEVGFIRMQLDFLRATRKGPGNHNPDQTNNESDDTTTE